MMLHPAEVWCFKCGKHYEMDYQPDLLAWVKTHQKYICEPPRIAG